MIADKYKICHMCKYFTEKIHIKGFTSNSCGIFANGDTEMLCIKKNCNTDKHNSCGYFKYDDNYD